MRDLRRPRGRWIAAIVLAVIAAGLVYGWESQSGYYAIWPDKAHPAAQYVHVPDGKAPAPDSGFYFVDVHVLEANRIEAQYFT